MRARDRCERRAVRDAPAPHYPIAPERKERERWSGEACVGKGREGRVGSVAPAPGGVQRAAPEKLANN